MNNVICWFYNNSWKKGILIEHNENITKVLYNNEYYNVSNDKILPRNKIHDIDNLKKCVHLNLPNIIESVKKDIIEIVFTLKQVIVLLLLILLKV